MISDWTNPEDLPPNEPDVRMGFLVVTSEVYVG